MINKVTLIGNLGADPEIRTLDSGTKVARMSVATNESYQDKASGEWKDKTEWHTVIGWRYQAEKAERDFKKGMRVYVDGKITYRKWQNQEGKDIYTTEIVANTMRSLEKRESSGYNNSFPTDSDAPGTVKEAPSTAAVPQAQKQSNPQEIEDDLPF